MMMAMEPGQQETRVDWLFDFRVSHWMMGRLSPNLKATTVHQLSKLGNR